MKARESIKKYTFSWFSKSYSCVVFPMIFIKFRYYFVAISLPSRACDFCLKNTSYQKTIFKKAQYIQDVCLYQDKEMRGI